MTDRHAGYIVVLEKDIREDDAEDIITAIGMIRGVLKCKPMVADPMNYIAEQRARHELHMKWLEVVYPEAERKRR